MARPTADLQELYNQAIDTIASSISSIVARSTNEDFRTSCYVGLQVPESGDFRQTLTEKLWNIASKKPGVESPSSEPQQQQRSIEIPQLSQLRQQQQSRIPGIFNTWSQQSDVGPNTQQSLGNTEHSMGQASEDFDDIELYASTIFEHDVRKAGSREFQAGNLDASYVKKFATEECVVERMDDDDEDWLTQAMKDMNDWTTAPEP